ncbi:MAB_1171c family putative transporter [Hamadaea sp. NPDC050747]|uniref:MAB_1171c family putative transporter n=1 Tax=Hamadaea sp. NPDC050747 TaxID=3155789 RepID=UPI003403FACF
MDNGENVAFITVAVVSLLVVARILIAQIKDPTPQRACIIVAGGLPACSFAAAAPAVYHRLNDFVGVPNVAVLIVYGGVLAYPTAMAAFLMIVVRGPGFFFGRRAWMWAVGYASTIVTMAVLFTLADVDVDAADPTAFDQMYATEPFASWMLIVYQLYFALGLALTAPYWWRLSRQTAEPWFRRGMPSIAIGSWLLLGYCIPKIAYLGLRQAGIDVGTLNTWAPVAAVAAAAFNIVGYSLCALAPVSNYRARWQAYQLIAPLWRSIVAPFPDVVLHGWEGPANPRLAIWPGRLPTLLYRRVVEISDARLQLKPYCDGRVAAAARSAAHDAGLAGIDADAAVEAAMLRAALAAHTAGTLPEQPATRDDLRLADAWDDPDGSQAAEVRWWATVARHYLQPADGEPVPGDAVAGVR